MLSRVRLSATPWTVARQAPLSLGILQARILEWVAMPSSRDLLNPGIEPRSPALQVDSLLSELPEKPNNHGVGSLSLLQGNFPSQESNHGLLHCRWILLTAELPGKPCITTYKVLKVKTTVTASSKMINPGKEEDVIFYSCNYAIYNFHLLCFSVTATTTKQDMQGNKKVLPIN